MKRKLKALEQSEEISPLQIEIIQLLKTNVYPEEPLKNIIEILQSTDDVSTPTTTPQQSDTDS